jgi:CRISPR-associated protein Csb2
MTLVLEIEYLSGVSFAALGPDSGTPDWPPQPDRIFSALVATWAARGQVEAERSALEWLEQLQPAPSILASEADPRSGAIVFVPPNDPRSDKQKNARGVLPGFRSRQPRRFPAVRPYNATLRLLWHNINPDETTVVALQCLASDTAYIGHSASLTRCRFFVERDCSQRNAAEPAQRIVYPGRLAELRRAFDAGYRPLSGRPNVLRAEALAESKLLFGNGWLYFEHVSGDMPDIRACALVAKILRATLLSGYSRIGIGDSIPEIVSGHAPDGAPSRIHHIAFVPLPFAGFPHADGHVMGFALITPRNSTILDDGNFLEVLRALAPIDERRGRRILTLKTKEGTPRDQAFSIDLSPTFEPAAGRRSLSRSRFIGPARIFASVTPIVLDRHLKERNSMGEIEMHIANACRNIGLPKPEAVVVSKHSAVEGAVSAYPSGRSPAWMRWRQPSSMANRPLTHAVIQFSSVVEGPVVLGAGRFVGLGLCLPLNEKPD